MPTAIKPVFEWHTHDGKGNLLGGGVRSKSDLKYWPNLPQIKTVTITARQYASLKSKGNSK